MGDKKVKEEIEMGNRKKRWKAGYRKLRKRRRARRKIWKGIEEYKKREKNGEEE